ncbi:MAG: TMEM165/GDT1 family protein [Limnochordia bacterium]
MGAFWLSFGIVFLAELGDKSQLLALTLATKYKAWVTLAGIFTATFLIHLLSVALGGAVGELLPTAWINFIAGLAFIGFGFWTLRGDSLDDDECNCQRRFASPFMLVTATFFCGELGDKTMLSTVTLAANNPALPVWLGSTLGMVLSDALAIMVGKLLGARLPERAIQVGAALIFFGFGLYGMYEGGADLSAGVWLVGVLAIALMATLYARAIRRPQSQLSTE